MTHYDIVPHGMTKYVMVWCAMRITWQASTASTTTYVNVSTLHTSVCHGVTTDCYLTAGPEHRHRHHHRHHHRDERTNRQTPPANLRQAYHTKLRHTHMSVSVCVRVPDHKCTHMLCQLTALMGPVCWSCGSLPTKHCNDCISYILTAHRTNQNGVTYCSATLLLFRVVVRTESHAVSINTDRFVCLHIHVYIYICV